MEKDEFELLHTDGPYYDRQEANRATLNHILNMGVTKGEKKEVWNYFYFNKLQDAREAAQDLSEVGFQVEELGENAVGNAILLLVKIQISLEESALDRLTSFLEDLAEKYHGKYDGWEVEISPGK